MPTAGIEGKRGNCTRFTLRRELFPLKFKIEGSEVGGPDDDAVPGMNSLFCRGGERLLASYFSVNSNGQAGVFACLDTNDDFVVDSW